MLSILGDEYASSSEGDQQQSSSEDEEEKPQTLKEVVAQTKPKLGLPAPSFDTGEVQSSVGVCLNWH
jgi:hypothetical protein